MSAGPTSVLERNLARLLRRSYTPVEPSVALRARVLAACEAELERRAARLRSGPAPSAPARTEPTHSEPTRTGPMRAEHVSADHARIDQAHGEHAHGATPRPQRISRAWIAAAALVLVALGALAWHLFGARSGAGASRGTDPALVAQPAAARPSDAQLDSRNGVHGSAADAREREARDTPQLSALESRDERREARRDDAVTASTPLDAAAQRAGLFGTVARASDGGAVGAYELVYWPLLDLPRVGEPELRAFQAADGAFALPEAAPARYHVLVRAAGLAGRVLEDVAVPLREPLRIELSAGATIRGRVVDARGAPVARAVVLCEALAPSPALPVRPELLPDAQWGGARTASDGRFELRDVPEGSQRLLLIAAGHAVRASEPLRVAAGAELELADLALTDGGRIEGRVEHDDGAAWPAVRVLASSMKFDGSALLFDMQDTDERGGYAIEHLPAGPFIVMHFGAAMKRDTPPVAFLPARVREGETTVADFVDRDALLTLTGRVRGADGKPVAYFSLSIGRPDDEGERWKSATTDADGVYAFRGLEPGAWELHGGRNMALSMCYIGAVELAGRGEFVRDFELPSGALRGRAISAESGAPIAKPLLLLFIERGIGEAPSFRGKCLGDVDGNFDFAALDAGRYIVWSLDESGRCATTRSAWTVLERGASIELPPLACGAAGELELRVVDARGAPIEGAKIVIASRDGEELPLSLDPRTDAAGVFRARGLAPGAWIARATDARGRSAELDVHIDARSEPGASTSLELVLDSR